MAKKRNKGRKAHSSAYLYAKEQEARASRLLKAFTAGCAVVVVLAIGAGMFGGGRGGFANPHEKVGARRPSQHELAVEYINGKLAEKAAMDAAWEASNEKAAYEAAKARYEASGN